MPDIERSSSPRGRLVHRWPRVVRVDPATELAFYAPRFVPTFILPKECIDCGERVSRRSWKRHRCG
jgi:hypothetical protein